MPPLTTQETIPNFPLNGWELAAYTRAALKRELDRRLVLNDEGKQSVLDSLTNSMASDYVFLPQYTYRDVSFTLDFQCHLAGDSAGARMAFSLDVKFDFPGNPLKPNHTPYIHRPVGMAVPPLLSADPDARHVVDCFTLSVKVDNPNLVRVHCGLPVVISEKKPPKYGDMFPEIQQHEIRYDPTDYDPLPEPTITEQSAEVSKRWGIDTWEPKPIGTEGQPATDMARVEGKVSPTGDNEPHGKATGIAGQPTESEKPKDRKRR